MLIVVEGCIGSGKTTVAEGLARHRSSVPLLEDFASNPFLGAFYADPGRHVIEAEFSFLLLHFHQMKNMRFAGQEPEVVADFHLWKDLIYADLNFRDPRAKRIFGELYSILLEQTPAPSLMVFLLASNDLIVERITQRRREFELNVDPDYFAKVNSAYGRKLCLPMSRWDFVRQPDLFGELSLLIDSQLES
jgi:deoxyguanosine kinase